MLVQFMVKNVLSFRDETILDMTAISAYKEHPSNLIDIGSDFSKNLGRKEVFRFTLTKNRLKYTTKYSIYTTKWPFWNEM